jgi:O-antigen ligase
VNFVYLVILALTWAGIESFIGGTRLLFSLPAYGLLSIGALLTVVSIRGKRIPPDAFCLGSTLLLGAWILIRATHSPVESLALPDFFMMIGCLMAYLITAFYLNGMLEQTILILVLWAIAAVEVLVGMIQFLKDPTFMLFGLMRPLDAIRASGMYISPNNFAGFLVTVAVISVSLGVWSRWPVWAKLLAFYVALFCLLGVAVSGSRGGYFATIGSLLAFATGSIYAIRVADPRKFLLVALGSLGGLVAVVGLAAFLMFNSGYLAHRMQTMASKDVRLYNWEAAIDHIRLSPWVGTGSGTHLIYGRLFRRQQIQVDPVHAHCDYLELVAEYGIVGAVCMALFLIAHIRRGLRSYSEILRRRIIPSGFHHSNSFAVQLGALCAVAGLAIHSVVDFDMHIPGNALVFAFLFGVLANPGMDRRLRFVDRRLTPGAQILLPALGAFMLWRGLPLLPSEYCAEVARGALRDHRLVDAIAYAKKGIYPVPPLSDSPDDQPKPNLLDTLLSKTGPNPKNPDLYFYMGEANRILGTRFKNPYLSRRYYTAATSAFETGLKVFPEDESMLVRYGQALDGLRNFAAAEAIYQKALALDPNLDLLHKYYADHLIAEGKKAEAEAIERERIKVGPVEVEPDQKADDLLQ